jgi:hypothetical protein
MGDIRSLNYQSVCKLIYKALHTLKDTMAMKLLAGFSYWLLAVSLIQVTALIEKASAVREENPTLFPTIMSLVNIAKSQ